MWTPVPVVQARWVVQYDGSNAQQIAENIPKTQVQFGSDGPVLIYGNNEMLLTAGQWLCYGSDGVVSVMTEQELRTHYRVLGEGALTQ